MVQRSVPFRLSGLPAIIPAAAALALFASSAPADTHTAASCAQADVQAAIDAAGTGDSVRLPAGTASWSGSLSISKGIQLQGAGAGGFKGYSRTVVRHCVFNNANIASHGAETSPKGLRHFELYDNTFLFDNLGEETLNLCRWIWIRGGTGIITDNVMPDLKSQMWGDGDEIQMIVMSLRRQCLYAGHPYPVPHQVGQGHNGEQDVLDPLFIWNNPGHPRVGWNDHEPDEVGRNLRSADYLRSGRDYRVDEPKPGYAKYAYPHPLRVSSRRVRP